MFHRVHIGLAHGGEYDIIESFVVIEIERAVDGVRKRNENDAMTAPANRQGPWIQYHVVPIVWPDLKVVSWCCVLFQNVCITDWVMKWRV
jgi:hypothetical protein